jgi:hypothetical protein
MKLFLEYFLLYYVYAYLLTLRILCLLKITDRGAHATQ